MKSEAPFQLLKPTTTWLWSKSFKPHPTGMLVKHLPQKVLGSAESTE